MSEYINKRAADIITMLSPDDSAILNEYIKAERIAERKRIEGPWWVYMFMLAIAFGLPASMGMYSVGSCLMSESNTSHIECEKQLLKSHREEFRKDNIIKDMMETCIKGD